MSASAGFVAPSVLSSSSSSLLASGKLRLNHCRTAPATTNSAPLRRAARAALKQPDAEPQAPQPAVSDVAVILLAGGTGSRMKADRPKQLLSLAGQPVLQHSIALFASLPEVSHLIVVLSAEHRAPFTAFTSGLRVPVVFAEPGAERQDSVFNGLALVPDTASLACVHDAARPLVTEREIRSVLRDASDHGAAVLGVPSKATIKESEDGEFVLRTISRDRLWEIQTPQVVRPQLLRDGFAKVRAERLAVTDDVSIIEHLGRPVKITVGDYSNIKLTTPDDMTIAESILEQRRVADAAAAPST